MQTSELRPCPFCGGEAYIRTVGEVAYIECVNCHCQTESVYYKEKEKIIKVWNNRSSNWHTGTPTEEGWYLLECNIGNSDEIYYVTDYWSNEVGYWTVNGVIRWQKIESYKEKEDGLTD